MGVPDPGPNDLWIQLLIRDKIEEIMDNEDLFDTITYSDSNNIILKKLYYSERLTHTLAAKI